MENWVKSKIWLNTYEKTKNFNGYTYRVSIIVEETRKSLKFWASISSGKKREDLEVYEEKDVKSKGGIKALIWCKNTILEFPKEYDADKKLKQFICIGWSDSRRRDIYDRLRKYGFNYSQIDNRKVLSKQINYESSL